MTSATPHLLPKGHAWREVFPVFLKLGLTSFGGPVAHLGFFRGEFVGKRGWLDEASYADIVALCQFLPGPASSQVGLAIGLLRAGPAGAFAAWLGFTLPSALAMILFGYGVTAFRGVAVTPALHGLKIVAVGVVAQAVIGMARTLAPDFPRAVIALVAAVVTLAVPTTLGQVGTIIAAGLVGWRMLAAPASQGHAHPHLSAQYSTWALALFVLLLAGLPVVAFASDNHAIQLFDAFYRAGALVFGGGHVVLPLLQASVVPPGWVTNDDFLAGYGAAQAVPGPLFTFSAYLGTVQGPPPNGIAGGLIALAAIFLPSFLLVFGTLPSWSRLRASAPARSALKGVNAAVVGLLLAALYNPVWTSAILSPGDFLAALVAFGLIAARVPPWAVVILGAAAGLALG